MDHIKMRRKMHLGLSGVIEPGRQSCTGIVRKSDQERIHPLDLGSLVVDDIRDELEQYGIVR